MSKKLSIKEYIFLASMLFGMFFGAGNLIFPVQMGQMAGSEMWPAIVGFCLTGVGLPLLGIAAMGISRSEGLLDMSSKVGKGFGYFFTCALYLSIGPLFAIPRTATVSFASGIAPFVSESNEKIALAVFSLLFFGAVLFFSLRPSGIMTWIGKILNPVFLLFLGVLVIVAIIRPMGSISANLPVENYAGQSFFTGFLEGYNTMDALASLAFGIVLITAIRGLGVSEPKEVSTSTLKSGFFSIVIMAVIYCSLAVVGAQSRSIIGISQDGGSALNQIADYYFGSFGAVLLGIIMLFACMKTAIGLVTSCATTFVEMFSGKCSYNVFAVGFCAISFVLANIGLSRIIALSVPVLMFLYPLTIMLILLCLLGGLFAYDKKVFVCTMTLTTLAALFEFYHALPEAAHGKIVLFDRLWQAYEYLPFAAIGMGWIVPAAIGVAAGLVIHFAKK